jgi:hypothetical protein
LQYAIIFPMSAAAPSQQDHAEAIAAATVGPERRLWLLELMGNFCMALLRAMKPGGAAAHLSGLVGFKVFAAIARAFRFTARLELETDRLLRDLTAGILPEPKAERRADVEPEEPEEPEEREERDQTDATETPDREPREPTENDKAFLARFEALEALLDQGAHADWTLPETIQRLCRVLGLKPDWSRWLGDDWLEKNFDLGRAPTLSPPAGGSTVEAGEGGGSLRPAPLLLPPPPIGCSAPLLRSRGPPPPVGEERLGRPPPPYRNRHERRRAERLAARL